MTEVAWLALTRDSAMLFDFSDHLDLIERGWREPQALFFVSGMSFERAVFAAFQSLKCKNVNCKEDRG